MSKYKETVILPNNVMPLRANLKDNECKVYAQWDADKIYSRMHGDGKNCFILHDGPPYANGDIHIGHALNKILKDFIVKWHYFQGQNVQFVPGWDCHGLPIEKKVKNYYKGNDFKSECRKYASGQIENQKKQFKALGIIADWDNHYETMSPSFESMISQSLVELRDKGLLERRKKPVYWSWKERTALAEAEVVYKDIESPSIVVEFSLDNEAICEEAYGASLLVWTTTPWTLPANVAVALNPNIEYVLIKHSIKYTIASKHYFDLLKLTNPEVECSVFDIRQLKEVYNPITGNKVPVIFDEYVSETKGTGCVHIAPGHGMEDYLLGLKYNLPIVMEVDDSGNYVSGVFAGRHVFEVNELVIEYLEEHGVLDDNNKITHSYPHCWRSDTPLIFRATDQWFLDLSKLREKAISEFNKVCMKDSDRKRMLPMLEGRPDWCISRQRTWGVNIFDSKDILDVWFDSGLTWRTLDKQADLYIEGNDQHRGWFQSSLWLGVALSGASPYKQLITHGFVVDGNGKKMSKSLGNVIDPMKVVDKYGAEVLRYWVASVDYTQEIQVSDEILNRAADGWKKLRNTLRYLVSNLPNEESKGKVLPFDKWIMSCCQSVCLEINKKFSQYNFDGGITLLSEFINNELSGIYMNAIKNRLYCLGLNDPSRVSVTVALEYILYKLIKLISPLFTYTAGEVLGYSPNWFKERYGVSIFDISSFEADVLITSNFDSSFWLESLEAFHYEFDKLKKSGVVKDTLEVGIECDRTFINSDDFFAVSYFDDISDCASLSEYSHNGFKFKIIKSKFNKCERCWKRNASGELCENCSLVVKSML